jgi:hypothetical protein
MKQEHRKTIARSVRICADVCTVASRQTQVSGRGARHRDLAAAAEGGGIRARRVAQCASAHAGKARSAST